MAFRNWKQELEDERPPRPSPWPFVLRVGASLLLLAGVAAGALWVWPGYLLPKPWVRPGPPPERLTLFFASDVQGYLEPCGCTEQRWGGIARMSGLVQAAPARATTLLVDVGDAIGGPQTWRRMGYKTYLRGLADLGAAAANVGLRETQLAASELRSIAGASGVPLISANVQGPGGEPLLATHRKLLIDNLRVTLVGVVTPDDRRPPGDGVRIGDVDEALGRLLPSLRPHTDVIVLLASAEAEQMRQLARAHPELDAILGGRVLQASRSVQRIGDCRLAWHAKKGQMLGRMDITIRADDGRPGETAGAMLVLDNDVPEDPAMLDLVEEYNGQMAQVVREGGPAALGVPMRPKPEGVNRYFGSESCIECHPKAYEIWEKSEHARAWASLVERRRDSNPACVACHVVDLGAGDGFRGIRLTPDRANVQCESCHGRGGVHVQARIAKEDPEVGRMPRVLPKSCESCHDWVHSPEFTYTPYWEKIKHGLD